MADDEKEPTKLWLVSAGDYSDYRVLGVFSTIEKAEDFQRKYNLQNFYYDGAEVEEITLDPEKDEPQLMYRVDINGESFEAPSYYSHPDARYLKDYEASHVQYGTGGWIGRAYGASLDLAFKNAYDMVSKKKAEVLKL